MQRDPRGAAEASRKKDEALVRLAEIEAAKPPALRAAVPELVTPPPPDWPAPLAAAAFHGPLGDLVRAIEPATEADPAALLFQSQVAFGSVAGRGSRFPVEATEHFPNEFLALIGQSSKARKGTSWNHVKRAFAPLDPEWAERTETSGSLSSGEGLIAAVRDGGDGDPGVSDKRLLVSDGEFASVLAVCERQGNTLSSVLRNAWDGGALGTMTRNNRLKATGAHVSIVGHITSDELARRLTTTDTLNGFANRFLFVCVRRSKLLPDGGTPDQAAIGQVRADLGGALAFVRSFGRVVRDADAQAMWERAYPGLSEGRPGLVGAVLGRAEAHVTRLALIYALADGSAIVRREHLAAALACWRYVEASAVYVFGDTLGDARAEDVLRLLRSAPGGLSRTELSAALSRNTPASEITRVLTFLEKNRLIARAVRPTSKGRKPEVWVAAGGYEGIHEGSAA